MDVVRDLLGYSASTPAQYERSLLALCDRIKGK